MDRCQQIPPNCGCHLEEASLHKYNNLTHYRGQMEKKSIRMDQIHPFLTSLHSYLPITFSTQKHEHHHMQTSNKEMFYINKLHATYSHI